MLTWQKHVLQNLFNLLSAETFAILSIGIMAQTSATVYITTQVNIINPNPYKYQRTLHLQT